MKKILIVDDERVLTDAYDMAFTKAHFTVFVANEPDKGLELAEKEHPDVILLDMLMPSMNGIEFLKELKKRKVSRSAVFGFSNIENEDVVNAARKMGVVDYLLKVNYTPRQIAELIQAYLSKFQDR